MPGLRLLHQHVPMEPLPEATLRRFRDAAVAMVAAARPRIVQAQAEGFAHHLKADHSFVTEVDLAVETQLRARIAAQFPDHGILGEEFPDVSPEAAFRWVIDPIDGTHSFRHRVPLFGTLLALLYHDVPVVGVIDLPMLGWTYSGARGLGAACNGRLLRLADPEPDDALQQEIIAVGDRKQFIGEGNTHWFDALQQAHPSVRTYCDAFGHGLALQGSVGAMLDVGLKRWDFAATQMLVREAGGAFHILAQKPQPEGSPTRYDVLFGKPAVVAWVMQVLALEGSPPGTKPGA